MKSLFLIMMLTIATATQAFSLPINKASCVIEGSDYQLTIDLKVVEAPDSPFLNFNKLHKAFSGTIELYQGDRLLISAVGAGVQTYTGKHFGWRFVGIDRIGGELRIVSPYGVDFAPYELTVSSKDLELYIEDIDFRCNIL